MTGRPDSGEADSGEAEGQKREGARRAKRRVVFFLLSMVLMDVIAGQAAARYLPPVDETARIPRQLEQVSIPRYIEAVRRAGSERPVVVFLGSSPTWGHRIDDGASTAPAAAHRALSRACSCGGCPRPATFNLASVGQFMSDRYYLASAVASDADVLAVQIDYHHLARKAGERPGLRIEGLPRIVGATVTESDARRSGLKPSFDPDAESALSRVLRRYSSLYREGGALTAAALGGRTPRSFLTPGQGAAGAVGEESLLKAAGDASFVDLDPALQGVILSRYAEGADFAIPSGSPELYYLRRLVRLARENGVRVLVYMNPLNLTPLIDSDLVDEERYARVSQAVQSTVERAGGRYVDFNRRPAFDEGSFFDISHLTPASSRRFGRMLSDEILRDSTGRGSPLARCRRSSGRQGRSE